MPKYEVVTPEGKFEITAPEGATEDQILSYAQSQLEARPPIPDPVQPDWRQADPNANLKGFALGMSEPLDAVAQMATRAVPEGVLSGVNEAVSAVGEIPVVGPVLESAGIRPATPASIDAKIKASEARRQHERAGAEGVDWARLGGNIPPAVAATAGLPANLLGGIAAGGIAGSMMPVTDTENFAEAKGQQVGLGMLGGAAGNVLPRTLARTVAPKVNQSVKALMDRGIIPTPGQVAGGGARSFESKLTSAPILGSVMKAGEQRAIRSFNHAIYDDILKPIGAVSPKKVGRAGVAEVGDLISQGYDDLLPKVSFRPDQEFMDDIVNLSQMAANLPKKEFNAYSRILDDKFIKVLGKTGRMDGRSTKELLSSLAGDAARFSKSSDAYQKQLGSALKELHSSLRRGLARSNQGVRIQVGDDLVDAGERLAALDLAWAKQVRLEKAAGSQGAVEGIVTPAQLSSAVKATDRSVRKRGYSRGTALMQDISDPAKEVLGSTYPDSGTAGRLAAMLLAGGAPAIDPTFGIVAAPMAAYTPLGQKLIANLMTKRPGFAAPVGSAIRKTVPATQAGLAASLAGQQ